MSLPARQAAFIAEIAADDDGPKCTSPGMAIYRNAYRARLTDALGTSFERTHRWVGADAFTAASAHYILTNPPISWTLDEYGAGFPAVLAQLFAEDGGVAELAWLEWHMQQAFAEPDLPELTAHGLAAAGLAEGDWEMLRFTMAAGFAARAVHHDCAGLWHAHSEDTGTEFTATAAGASALVVWRRRYSPHFRQLECDEFAALSKLAMGASFGETAALAGDQGIARFGAWFAGWLSEGLFSKITV